MYLKAEEKIQSEFNISKMIKGLRNLNILIENSLMGDDKSMLKYKIMHTEKNVINLDSYSDKND